MGEVMIVPFGLQVPRGRWVALVLAMAAAVAGSSASPARATLNSTPEKTFVTNGPVYAVAPTPSAVYIGGDFTQVGPRTGPGVGIDASTARTIGLPEVAGGSLQTVVADGKGGFFIGGLFSHVGGIPRTNLAHIFPNGNVDPRFHPAPDNGVEALALSGKKLYVGGYFHSIGDKTRHGIAALRKANGTVTRWKPRGCGTSSDGCDVRALAVSKSRVYVGGLFTRIGGKFRSGIAALKVKTGKATRWNPRARRFGDPARVNALALRRSKVYVGGNFSTIGGKHRWNVAALRASKGRATSWNPRATPGASRSVDAIAVHRRTVYVGGSFSTIGGADRNGIAAIRRSTGKATHWDPNPPAHSLIRALAISGKTLYAGGNFDLIGGEPRNGLAALDRRTGSARAWNPNTNGGVGAIAVAGSTVYVGGGFNSIGGLARNNIAALDPASGKVTGWNPNANGDESPPEYNLGPQVHVGALAASGATVYAGGYFDTIGGRPRYCLAALDAATGEATNWNPQPDSLVEEIDVAKGKVYVAGEFSSVGGENRASLASLDPVTGAATGWDPHPSGYVYAVVVSGSTVYVGGSFSSIGGHSRQNIAALDETTGGATAWNPGTHGNPAYVNALVPFGSTMYAAGFFDRIGGRPRTDIAALDAATGAATGFDPNPTGSNGASITALALADSTVYAGGAFDSIGGEARRNVAGLDARTSAANRWNPDPQGGVDALAAAADGSLWVGGDFSAIGGVPQSGIAEFKPAAPGN